MSAPVFRNAWVWLLPRRREQVIHRLGLRHRAKVRARRAIHAT